MDCNTALSNKQDNSWTTSTIKDANEKSGFQKFAQHALTPLFYGTNCALILYTWCVYLALFLNQPIPEFLSSYVVNPICTINAMLLIVLYNGHDRYYSITKRTLILSDHTLLQCLDLLTKVSLVAVSVIQCLFIDSFVLICLYGYVLTFFRVLYLNCKLDKDHPLWKKVHEAWMPNNIRHNLVMLLWVVMYYFILQPSGLYYIISHLLDISIDFKNEQVINMLYITRLSFLIIFNTYWIYRVLHKVIVKKNLSFKARDEQTLMRAVDEYYVKKDTT